MKTKKCLLYLFFTFHQCLSLVEYYIYSQTKGTVQMGSSEKFCLKWNDFTSNITSSLNQIINDPEFSDVTLACGGDQKFEAYKVILASSSRFFSNILKQNKHPHPLIYMTGVNTNQISAVMDLIYHWEVSIFQEDLDAFLILAEELEIKGLGSFDAGQNMPDRTPAYNIPPKRTNNKFQQIYENKGKKISFWGIS